MYERMDWISFSNSDVCEENFVYYNSPLIKVVLDKYTQISNIAGK